MFILKIAPHNDFIYESKVRLTEWVFSWNMTPWGTAKPQKSRLFVHANLLWCHELLLVSMSEGQITAANKKRFPNYT